MIICGFNTEYCGLFNAIGTVNNADTYEMPGLDINDFVSTVLHWSGVIDVLDFDEFIE